MSQYLMTVAELIKNSAGKLGTMDQGTYSSFMEQAKEVGRQKGISDPRIGIAVIFKPGAHSFLTEIPYPISEPEWQTFLGDARTMCESMPEVHVYDGQKFCLPI